MPKKRVLLVDDSAEIRRLVRPLFDKHPKFRVVGGAEHGREAVEIAPTLRPDLIILDLTAASRLVNIAYLPQHARSRAVITGGRYPCHCSQGQSSYPSYPAGRGT